MRRTLLALLLALGTISDANAQGLGPSNWTVGCNENQVTTVILCSASRRADGVQFYSSLSVVIARTRSGAWARPMVHVLNDWPTDDHPATLRIDENRPIVFTRKRIVSDHSEIIEQMLKGKIARGQTSKWPSCRDCQQWEISLSGFSKAFEELKVKARAKGWSGA